MSPNIINSEFTIDNLIEEAPKSGVFARFPVSRIDYKPIRRVADRICLGLYDVEMNYGVRRTDKYKALEQKGLRPITLPDEYNGIQIGKFDYEKSREGLVLDAELIIYKEGKDYYGVLDIKKLTSQNPQISVFLFSDNALQPFKHKIEEFNIGSNKHVNIFTQDQDGSKWYFSCQRKNENNNI
jgi:hypothetical protein